MRKTLVALVTVAVAALIWAFVSSAAGASASAAKTTRLFAKMDSRQVVTPKNRSWKAPASVARAKGTFAGTLNSTTRKLIWRITYTGLRRGATYVDLHIGKPGRFGPIIVRLCKQCKSGESGVTRVRRVFVDQIASANSWVTVLTTAYPNGVIRGQIRLR